MTVVVVIYILSSSISPCGKVDNFSESMQCHPSRAFFPCGNFRDGCGYMVEHPLFSHTSSEKSSFGGFYFSGWIVLQERNVGACAAPNPAARDTSLASQQAIQAVGDKRQVPPAAMG